jgi:outer membrane protein assembly factor BamB
MRRIKSLAHASMTGGRRDTGYCDRRSSSRAGRTARPIAALLAGALALGGCDSTPSLEVTSVSVDEGWSRFRGPNGSGVATAVGLPTRFGPGDNEAWRTPLPPGHSSPVLAAGRIFLTAVDEGTLYTYAVDQTSGEVLWRQPAPRPREEPLNRLNNPASPTPATDGSGVYVFFGDFGLIAYDADGSERWQLPLGPFDNAYGMAASPVVVNGQVIQVCDQKTGAFMIAVGAQDGVVRWRVDRPGSSTGHSTPIVFRPPTGETQLLIPGSFRLAAFAPSTGERLWWVSGLAFEMKAVPVLSADSATVYINGTSSTAFDDSHDGAIPPYDDVVEYDTDGDGLFQPEQIPDELARRWIRLIDLDGDGALNRQEWEWFRSARASRGGINAFKTGGRGDMTASSFRWNHGRSVPQLPSALLYEGILYMVDDGGIVTLLDPDSGEVLHRGRLYDAIESYFASPVAGDGKVFMVSEACKVAVLRPGPTLDILVVNDLDDICFATPAIDENHIYLRTRSALHAFAVPAPAGSSQRP